MPVLPKTLGELRHSEYHHRPVKDEIRHNLIHKLQNGETLFPDIVGYDQSVIPQITNALLAGQDIILLGERGQAKSRIVRSLISLLDKHKPVLANCEIPENPFSPITTEGQTIVREQGDDAEIRWMQPDERFAEKLSTPDITIADLIGEIDPVKVAEGRYLSDQLTIHYGLVPRVNLGIFAINELPDLTERIQVGLLNVLQERDIQIRGYKIRLPLDVFLVATANPEDYTNRGRIITPLKDRYGAQIRTHYPHEIESEIGIMEQEATAPGYPGYRVHVPYFMKEIIAEITHEARRSPDINQRSGVSVRASISNFEALLGNAFRRSLNLGEKTVCPRVSDLAFVVPSLQGKVEFEAMEEGEEDDITEKVVAAAVKRVFDRYFSVEELESVVLSFNDEVKVVVAEDAPNRSYTKILNRIEGLREIVQGFVRHRSEVSAAVELILEGLHQHRHLNKHSSRGQTIYTE